MIAKTSSIESYFSVIGIIVIILFFLASLFYSPEDKEDIPLNCKHMSYLNEIEVRSLEKDLFSYKKVHVLSEDMRKLIDDIENCFVYKSNPFDSYVPNDQNNFEGEIEFNNAIISPEGDIYFVFDHNKIMDLGFAFEVNSQHKIIEIYEVAYN